jgi:ATP-dependent Clp protease ATP-binding subunit ClpC
MTTNLGTRDISGTPLGFTSSADTATGYDRMRGKVVEELKKNFKPEFLNRVDETIVFPQLTQPELLQIVDLFIKRLSDRLMDRDMTVEIGQAAKEHLILIGFDPSLGARPLRRAIQREVEDRLSERILTGDLNAGDHVHVDYVNDEFVFTTGRQPGREAIEEPVAAIEA